MEVCPICDISWRFRVGKREKCPLCVVKNELAAVLNGNMLLKKELIAAKGAATRAKNALEKLQADLND
ncbi:MAG: hypothetical protein ISR65_18445 [Bacteriovoracaceae bacterium]|nr:hypothetical protein [candidate division KSB1 bacterium]MBL6991768.1 hypothetical protein [Bacteriovoracaceae bacterium]